MTLPTDMPARFWAKVEKTADCWIWTASLRPGGYGQFAVGRRRPPAHRVAYELLVGPIPEGLQLDHLCRNRACVNPEHLEPVTNRENTIRGLAPVVNGERMRARTHCKYGHPLFGDNAALDVRGRRRCRACSRRQSRSYLGPRATTRVRGPMRAVVERITSRIMRLECGHVITRGSGHRPNTARCDQCEYHDNPPESAA